MHRVVRSAIVAFLVAVSKDRVLSHVGFARFLVGDAPVTSSGRGVRRACALAACLAALAILPGCHGSRAEPAGFPVVDPTADCLPDARLTDAHGSEVSLTALRGAPVLFDFIYTSCPGPCSAITARMVGVAKALQDSLGKTVHFVSITVDPEHDRADQLLAFAEARGADRDGWRFLTGTPEQIDELMRRFSLVRRRTADGGVDHVLEFFLVGPDGHPLRQYRALETDAAAIAGDVRRVIAGGRLG